MNVLASASSRRAAAWTLAVLVLLGAALRVGWLGQEVVGVDEIHPLTVLRGSTLGEILTRFRLPDNCIPITAWSWLLASTVGLEEYGFRLLAWLPGILLVWLLPRALRPLLPTGDRLLLAAVLATSPVLVLWSREARPYAAVNLLGPLAVVALVHHVRERTRRWLVACAACQFGLFLFSPTTAPFLLGLGLAAALWSALSTRGQPARRRWTELAHALAPSALALASIAVLLGPALLHLSGTLEGLDPRWTSIDARTYRGALQVLFGFALPSPDLEWYAFPLLALCVWGLVALARRDRAAGLATPVVLLVPFLAYSLARFEMIEIKLVFVRYQAALVPLYLALAVLGLADLRRRLAARRPGLARGLVVLAFGALAVHVARGPLPDGLPPRAPFGLRQSRLVRGATPDEWPRTARAPRIYRELGEEPPAVVVEWPFEVEDELTFVAYQALHGGRVVRCSPPRVPPARVVAGADRLRFRTFLWEEDALAGDLPPEAVVVLHLRPDAERAWVQRGRRTEPLPSPASVPTLERFRTLLGGRPFHADDWVEAYRTPVGP